MRPAGVEPASRATVNGLGATPQLRHTDAPYIINSALIAALGRALSTSPRYYICVADAYLLSALGAEATLNTSIVYLRRERRPDGVCLQYVNVRIFLRLFGSEALSAAALR